VSGAGGLPGAPVDEPTGEVTRLQKDLERARATNTILNRRAQAAEAAVAEKVSASGAQGLGRRLANAAAAMYLRERDEARAARDRLQGALRTIEENTRPDGAWADQAVNVYARAALPATKEEEGR
jgi:hypothetical protein